MALGAVLSSGALSYSCDSSIDSTQAGTCAYLNSVVAGQYGSIFSNANASIYIKMGVTGLGESTTGFFNFVSYSTYLGALAAASVASGNPIQVSAVASLNSTDTTPYSGDQVEVTSALGAALGLGGMVGTTSSGAPCFTPGSGGCYNGIITITTPANLSSETAGTQSLYWDQTGGSIGSSSYDFYSVVEHETDEVLGTSSCMDTGGGNLTDPCDGGAGASAGTGTPAAVDLFRFTAPGVLALNAACIGQTTCTANPYFSYDAGNTNGVANGSVWNPAANGNDYSDFAENCKNVQDGTGCLGKALFINTDGGAEVNILNAVGFQENPSVPEPGTIALFGTGLAALGASRLRRRRS
jgi:hypothetical protein